MLPFKLKENAIESEQQQQQWNRNACSVISMILCVEQANNKMHASLSL